jgi:hypothetical protein
MPRHSACFALAALALLPAAASADVIKLKAGGELHGTVVEAPEADGEAATIRTLSGGTISVPLKDVEFVTRRPLAFEEYEVKAKTAPDTVEAQWALAEWCRDNHLDEQRKEHLGRIVALQPDHKQARAALGHVSYNGEWMTREDMMGKRGLVQHRGRWITPQELELIEKTQAERDREQSFFAEIRKLKGWLKGPNADLRNKAAVSLRALRDPDAVPALERAFRDDPDPQVRGLYVSVLSAMPGTKPVKPLVTQSLHDVDRQVRYAALGGIDEPRYEAALPYYLQGLRSDMNDVVRRAGAALEKVGDERAVPDLIKALITTHQYRVQVPDNTPTYSFNTNGTFGAGGVPLPPDVAAALAAGALPNGVSVVDTTAVVRTKVIPISVNQENPEVLAALRKITGETFGYDERTWRLWLAAKKNGAG